MLTISPAAQPASTGAAHRPRLSGMSYGPGATAAQRTGPAAFKRALLMVVFMQTVVCCLVGAALGRTGDPLLAAAMATIGAALGLTFGCYLRATRRSE